MWCGMGKDESDFGDLPAFQRTGFTSSHGKLDAFFQAFRIASAAKDAWTQLAHESDKNDSEFLRELLDVLTSESGKRFIKFAQSEGVPPWQLLKDFMDVITLGEDRAKMLKCGEIDRVMRMLPPK